MPYWEGMPDQLVDVYEAASLLAMSRAAVDRLAKRGVLRCQMQGSRRFFRPVDLEAFIEVRGKGKDPEAAFFEARQAAIETRAMRKELDNIKFVLGIDTMTLATDRDSIVSLLLKTEDALRGTPILEPEELLLWAKTLYCLSENHFEAITFHTDQKQPWRAFLALGRKLCQYEDVRSTRDDPELYTIYRLLNAALRSARQAAYFHIRTLYGHAYAARLLPEVKGCPHEEVIALAFNV